MPKDEIKSILAHLAKVLDVNLKKTNENIEYLGQGNTRTKLDITIQWVTLVTSICTVIGLLFGIPALIVANMQLRELNAKAQIEFSFFLKDNLVINHGVSQPFQIHVTAQNRGSYDPSYWRAVSFFCKNVNVLKSENWIESGKNIYFFESQKSLPPGLTISAPDLDWIGSFEVSLQIDQSQSLQEPIPIALVAASGDRTNSDATLISLSSGGFIREKILFNDGQMISNSRNCADSL